MWGEFFEAFVECPKAQANIISAAVIAVVFMGVLPAFFDSLNFGMFDGLQHTLKDAAGYVGLFFIFLSVLRAIWLTYCTWKGLSD